MIMVGPKILKKSFLLGRIKVAFWGGMELAEFFYIHIV